MAVKVKFQHSNSNPVTIPQGFCSSCCAIITTKSELGINIVNGNASGQGITLFGSFDFPLCKKCQKDHDIIYYYDPEKHDPSYSINSKNEHFAHHLKILFLSSFSIMLLIGMMGTILAITNIASGKTLNELSYTLLSLFSMIAIAVFLISFPLWLIIRQRIVHFDKRLRKQLKKEALKRFKDIKPWEASVIYRSKPSGNSIGEYTLLFENPKYANLFEAANHLIDPDVIYL